MRGQHGANRTKLGLKEIAIASVEIVAGERQSNQAGIESVDGSVDVGAAPGRQSNQAGIESGSWCGGGRASSTGANRTKLGLKARLPSWPSMFGSCANRTKLGLKGRRSTHSARRGGTRQSNQAGIESTSLRSEDIRPAASANRTKLGLKGMF